MENFKEIAEKCLTGELSGTFLLRNHKPLHSKYLYRYMIGKDLIPGYYYLGGIILNAKGEDLPNKERVQNFIPDNMKEQIKIDIPEGKVPVMEQTENGVVITWKENPLTYVDVESQLKGLFIVDKYINVDKLKEGRSKNFYKKVEVLRKLTNIRNYFGKPDGTKSGYYIYESDKCGFQAAPTGYPGIYANGVVAFKEREHAEQAIKMLGDELKYLFEPW